MKLGSLLKTLKYCAVIFIGFGIDFGITLALTIQFKLTVTVAVIIGYLSALIINYTLFEYWVFKRDSAMFSPPRLFQIFIASIVALLVRIGVIKFAEHLLGKTPIEIMVLLLLAAGASMLVNFLLVRLVFSTR